MVDFRFHESTQRAAALSGTDTETIELTSREDLIHGTMVASAHG